MRLIDADRLLQFIHDSRCADCEEVKADRSGASCAACQWDDVIMTIETAPTVGEWVSVKDRLPETYEAVIVSVIGHDFEPYVSVAWISADNEWDTDDNLLCRCSWEVTHWMSMPELPPEVTEDETD